MNRHAWILPMLLLAACQSMPNQPGATTRGQDLKCERFVQLVGRNITFKGLSIPGADKVYTLGELSYTEAKVQEAGQAVIQYDLSHKSICNIAKSYVAGSPRRIELEDKMVSLASGAVAAAKSLSDAIDKQQADAAIKTVEKDAHAKATSAVPSPTPAAGK